MHDTPPIPVYIAAGGRSSRFGSDKARATLEGRALIVRVADGLRPVASRVTAIADQNDRYADLGIDTIADRTPGCGPLGALEAALHDRLERDGKGWLLLAACDLVEVEVDWVRALASEAIDGRLAVAFHNDRWQPLLALYHTDILPRVKELLSAKRLAIRGLLDEVGGRRVAPPKDWPSTPDANTPEDLQRAARRRDQRTTPPPGDAP